MCSIFSKLVVVLNQVSRNNSLRIPKKIELVVKSTNSHEDEIGVKEAIATSTNQKFNRDIIEKTAKTNDTEQVIDKIPSNASELMVITVLKKLCAYVILITEKSPKKFRGVFVNRMQNHLLDALEDLLQANFIRMDSVQKKQRREQFQKDAIVKLKMVGYISMVAVNAGCILPKQYKQISIQIAEAINLVAAWKKVMIEGINN